MKRIALIFLALLPLGGALAAPAGKLDPTFGNAGRRVLAHDAGGDMADSGRVIVQEADGSLTLVSEAARVANGSGIGFSRLTRDGDSIPAQAPSVFAHPDIYSLRPFGARRMPDGKLLVAGEMRKTPVYVYDGFVCRFNADLSLDTAFGGIETPGCRILVRGSIYGMDVQADGKLLFVGRARVNGEYRAAVMRTDTNAVLDGSFGTGGIATRNVGASFSDVAQAPTGRIVAIGTTAIGNEDMLLAAFQADGSADFDFSDGGGVFALGAPNDEQAFGSGVAVAPNGHYVFTGMFDNADDEGTSVAVLRLLPNGNAAPGFGIGLRLYDPCAFDLLPCRARGEDVAVLPDGRIVIAGMSGPVADGHSIDFFAMRLLANGNPDTAFGAQNPNRPGMVSIAFQLDGPDSFDPASAVALQGERVLLLGSVASTKGEDDRDVAIVRLDDGLSIFADGLEID